MYVILFALLIALWAFMIAPNYLDLVWQWIVAAGITFVLTLIASYLESKFLLGAILFSLLFLTAIFQFKKKG